jgi:hypothetical protein
MKAKTETDEDDVEMLPQQWPIMQTSCSTTPFVGLGVAPAGCICSIVTSRSCGTVKQQ